MNAWISVAGIFNHRPDIFDELTLPVKADIVNDKIEYIDNIEELDRETLINNILFELGELELLYADPDFLKSMIGVWARLEKGNWLSLWETMLYKYNPIWNKDGEIIESRDLEKGGTVQIGKSGTIGNVRTLGTTKQLTNQESGTASSTSSGNRTIAHNVTGYDTNSYSPNTQDVENTSGSVNGSDSRSGSGTVTDTGTITDQGTSSAQESSESAGTESETSTRIERGNIGVTMTQDMIKQQREIVQFNILEYITQSFKRRFCLMVY